MRRIHISEAAVVAGETMRAYLPTSDRATKLLVVAVLLAALVAVPYLFEQGHTAAGLALAVVAVGVGAVAVAGLVERLRRLRRRPGPE